MNLVWPETVLFLMRAARKKKEDGVLVGGCSSDSFLPSLVRSFIRFIRSCVSLPLLLFAQSLVILLLRSVVPSSQSLISLLLFRAIHSINSSFLLLPPTTPERYTPMQARKEKNMSRTRGVLAAADLDELLDVLDFLGHDGRFGCRALSF